MMPCEQADKIRHIENDLENHKVWRNATTAQLTSIQVSMATLTAELKALTSKVTDNASSVSKDMDTKLKSFDDHVKAGDAFRVGLILTALALSAAIITGVIEFGRMEQKLDISYRHSMKAAEDAP
jgi:hypothetical protein